MRRKFLDNLKLCQDNDDEKFTEVIKAWKDSRPSPVTWQTVITALESPIIDSKEIADKIRAFVKSSKLLLLSDEVVLLALSLSINCIVQNKRFE